MLKILGLIAKPHSVPNLFKESDFSKRESYPVTHHNPLWQQLCSWLFFPKGINNQERLSLAVKGKVILITGASFGIGEATAYQLSAAGAIVLLVGRTEEKLLDVVEKIRSSGGQTYEFVIR